MTNNFYLINTIRFVLLVLVQVLVFNRLNFYGFINPMVYILFLYWFPVKENKIPFIISSFLLGFFIDLFSDSMAINTAATVSIAYLRPALMRFCFGVNYEFQNFKITSTTRLQQITFLSLLILIHHIIFFSLEIFNLTYLLVILKKVLATSLVSWLFCLLFSSLFSVKRK